MSTDLLQGNRRSVGPVAHLRGRDPLKKASSLFRQPADWPMSTLSETIHCFIEALCQKKSINFLLLLFYSCIDWAIRHRRARPFGETGQERQQLRIAKCQ